jgi:hypothetical protein
MPVVPLPAQVYHLLSGIGLMGVAHVVRVIMVDPGCFRLVEQGPSPRDRT